MFISPVVTHTYYRRQILLPYFSFRHFAQSLMYITYNWSYSSDFYYGYNFFFVCMLFMSVMTKRNKKIKYISRDTWASAYSKFLYKKKTRRQNTSV